MLGESAVRNELPLRKRRRRAIIDQRLSAFSGYGSCECGIGPGAGSGVVRDADVLRIELGFGFFRVCVSGVLLMSAETVSSLATEPPSIRMRGSSHSSGKSLTSVYRRCQAC